MSKIYMYDRILRLLPFEWECCQKELKSQHFQLNRYWSLIDRIIYCKQRHSKVLSFMILSDFTDHLDKKLQVVQGIVTISGCKVSIISGCKAAKKRKYSIGISSGACCDILDNLLLAACRTTLCWSLQSPPWPSGPSTDCSASPR